MLNIKHRLLALLVALTMALSSGIAHAEAGMSGQHDCVHSVSMCELPAETGESMADCMAMIGHCLIAMGDIYELSEPSVTRFDAFHPALGIKIDSPFVGFEPPPPRG